MNYVSKSAGICLMALLVSLPSAILLAQQAVHARKKIQSGKRILATTAKVDSVAYAFGMSLAQDLKQRGMISLDPNAVALAVKDVFDNKPAKLTEAQQRDQITNALARAMAARDTALRKDAVSFMQKNKLKPGIHSTASGLQYEIIRTAEGGKPGLDDTVQVNYRGALANGKQFDSSYDRGEPNSFGVSQVIPGWTEGLQLMSPGAHYRFFIPYELGYGERGAGDDIPPYSPLIFDVELLSVKKALPEAVANK